MRILVVEDEVRLAQAIRRGLTTQPSFVVDLAHDGEDGEHLILTNDYDAVVLDLMLPGKPGLDVLHSVRSSGKRTPILILTALGTKEDVVRGLDLGSDDYLAKPFDFGELIARVKALVRRSHRQAANVIRVQDLEIDTGRHLVRRAGKEFLPRALEYRLLEYLAFRANEVVSKTDLLDHLYDYNWEKFSNVLEVTVSALRKKLEAPGLPKLIHTIRGQGYLLGRLEEGGTES